MVLGFKKVIIKKKVLFSIMAYIFLIRISLAINLALDIIKPERHSNVVAKVYRKIEEIKHGKHSVVTSLLLPVDYNLVIFSHCRLIASANCYNIH